MESKQEYPQSEAWSQFVFYSSQRWQACRFSLALGAAVSVAEAGLGLFSFNGWLMVPLGALLVLAGFVLLLLDWQWFCSWRKIRSNQGEAALPDLSALGGLIHILPILAGAYFSVLPFAAPASLRAAHAALLTGPAAGPGPAISTPRASTPVLGMPRNGIPGRDAYPFAPGSQQSRPNFPPNSLYNRAIPASPQPRMPSSGAPPGLPQFNPSRPITAPAASPQPAPAAVTGTPEASPSPQRTP